MSKLVGLSVISNKKKDNGIRHELGDAVFIIRPSVGNKEYEQAGYENLSKTASKRDELHKLIEEEKKRDGHKAIGIAKKELEDLAESSELDRVGKFILVDWELTATIGSGTTSEWFIEILRERFPECVSDHSDCSRSAKYSKEASLALVTDSSIALRLEDENGAVDNIMFCRWVAEKAHKFTDAFDEKKEWRFLDNSSHGKDGGTDSQPMREGQPQEIQQQEESLTDQESTSEA